MSTKNKIASLLIGSVTLFSFIGCGGTTNPVTGRVTVDGKPANQGLVTFYPVDGGRPGSGPIDAEGNFIISYKEMGDGLPEGKYRVTIVSDSEKPGGSTSSQGDNTSDPMTDDAFLPDETNVPNFENDDLIHFVPTKYNRKDTTPLEIEITPNMPEDAFNFDLEGEN